MNAGSDVARGSILPSIELNVLNHLQGPDPAEGIRSFQDGRPPDWRPMRAGQGPEPAAGWPRHRRRGRDAAVGTLRGTNHVAGVRRAAPALKHQGLANPALHTGAQAMAERRVGVWSAPHAVGG